ncbi:MAG: ferrous iron transport protein B [Prevotellaceae bacterium]|jgi:ferrous iron transport protein B|nr:ferrous iron transport protein B [Prevotellaceae bacterium]
MRLSELQTGEKGVIVKVMGRKAFRNRLNEMGFVKGKQVEVLLRAPLGNPIKYRILDYEVSLRSSEAQLIEVVSEQEIDTLAEKGELKKPLTSYEEILREIALNKRKTINVALVGNPNVGKTSLFNIASGAREHVGNYSGVTVDAKQGTFKYKGYIFNIVDLPGTYSLSAYSPEERYAKNYVQDQTPDVVINVVAASALERNLLLTTQLIDMDPRMVIALNMYDELEESGNTFHHEAFGKLIGVPIVPTVSKRSRGIPQLFDQVIAVYEDESPIVRHIHINYGEVLEPAICRLHQELGLCENLGSNLSKRYLAVQLLEGDDDAEKLMEGLCNQGKNVLKLRDKLLKQVESLLKEDAPAAFADARYGFIEGALRETYSEKKGNKLQTTKLIDSVVTDKYLGFPIFFFIMWLMFTCTFRLGQYPMDWIEEGVAALGGWISGAMSDGPFKDLLVDGIIGGVGSVIVFLPNILILYLFISFMEDTGYMARASFIMDKLMHRMGLHGKSFVPLIMGFGCNVPAIMGTRTIESRSNRMITMLIIPFMSCNARIPVYVLLIGTFFSSHAAWMMFAIYFAGIVIAILSARLFKRFLFKREDVPFVMELPPYRTPTIRATLLHMWSKAKQYLKKMGGIILVASIIIWFLNYFPRDISYSQDYEVMIEHAESMGESETAKELGMLQEMERQEKSYIGRIGKVIEPVIKPLGFDWKIGVSLFTGMAAKEVVVSTMGVLYSGDEETDPEKLGEKLLAQTDKEGKPIYTPLVAISLLLFVLIYFPCIAVIAAIKGESGSWKWALFTILYTTGLAWVVSFIVFQVGSLFGL